MASTSPHRRHRQRRLPKVSSSLTVSWWTCSQMRQVHHRLGLLGYPRSHPDPSGCPRCVLGTPRGRNPRKDPSVELAQDLPEVLSGFAVLSTHGRTESSTLRTYETDRKSTRLNS